MLDLVTEIIRSVRTYFAPHVEARAQSRANHVALAFRVQELELEQRYARATELERQYPFGSSGRLRQRCRPGLAPSLLVSPVAWEDADSELIGHTVSDHISDLDPTGAFLQVVSGGFVRDGHRLRVIDGGVRAAEIAELEFSPAPSLIVYFERSAEAVSAKMLLTHMIPTSDGEPSLTMPLARLTADGLHFAELNEPGLYDRDIEWTFMPVESSHHAGVASMGWAIAGFAAAVTSLYWQLQGVRWRVRDSVVVGETPPALTSLLDDHAIGEPAAELTFAERLEHELAALVSANLSPEVCDMPDNDGVGLLLEIDDAMVWFAIDRGYPKSPPRIFRRDTDGCVEQIALHPSQWEPSQSIAELASALR